MCQSPQLFAAYHVLHRLREPRHPPSALTYFCAPGNIIAAGGILKLVVLYFNSLFYFASNMSMIAFFFRGEYRIRTDDPLLAKQVL